MTVVDTLNVALGSIHARFSGSKRADQKDHQIADGGRRRDQVSTRQSQYARRQEGEAGQFVSAVVVQRAGVATGVTGTAQGADIECSRCQRKPQ